MPAARTPAQQEASRRNGKKSRGLKSAAGKARASQNALKHGLCSEAPLLFHTDDEDRYMAHEARLMEDYAPACESETLLVRQIALLFWRSERAEALEDEVLSTRERRVMGHYAGGYQPDSPLMWDPQRFALILRYRAQIERGLVRLIRLLREIQAERREGLRDEPTPQALRNEPEPAPPPANDDRPGEAAAAPAPAPTPAADALRNEPDAFAQGLLAQAQAAGINRKERRRLKALAQKLR